MNMISLDIRIIQAMKNDALRYGEDKIREVFWAGSKQDVCRLRNCGIKTYERLLVFREAGDVPDQYPAWLKGSQHTSRLMARLRAIVGDFEEAGEEALLRDYLIDRVTGCLPKEGKPWMSRAYRVHELEDQKEPPVILVEWSSDGENWQTAADMWAAQPLMRTPPRPKP